MNIETKWRRDNFRERTRTGIYLSFLLEHPFLPGNRWSARAESPVNFAGFKTGGTQSGFEINKVKGLLQERLNFHSIQIASYS
ncbi:MAG: hypothetical protein M1398_05710, partial [Deltaproteobacteria bacterium]|nr:hypothetical protein [Deltaproteobacteria bacterium]